MFKDYNQKIRTLFQKSGLNKAQFSKRIGIQKQNLNGILNNSNRLSEKTYNRYLDNFNKTKDDKSS